MICEEWRFWGGGDTRHDLMGCLINWAVNCSTDKEFREHLSCHMYEWVCF